MKLSLYNFKNSTLFTLMTMIIDCFIFLLIKIFININYQLKKSSKNFHSNLFIVNHIQSVRNVLKMYGFSKITFLFNKN